MKEVTIHSDGVCKGNPGPGGWAAVLRYGPVEREISGGAPATTNNRMELQAALEALNALHEPCRVNFYTDSAYLRNGITRWVVLWIERNWITKGNRPVQNQELWKQLHDLSRRHHVTWHWTKCHAKKSYNLRCDRLARLEVAKVNRSQGTKELRAHLYDFVTQHWHENNVPVDDSEK